MAPGQGVGEGSDHVDIWEGTFGGGGDSHCTGHRQEGACRAFLRNSKARVAAAERGSGNEVREDRIDHAGSL